MSFRSSRYLQGEDSCLLCYVAQLLLLKLKNAGDVVGGLKEGLCHPENTGELPFKEPGSWRPCISAGYLPPYLPRFEMRSLQYWECQTTFREAGQS